MSVRVTDDELALMVGYLYGVLKTVQGMTHDEELAKMIQTRLDEMNPILVKVFYPPEKGVK